MATEQETAPAETGEQGTGLQLTPEQQSVLTEHGITVPEDGKISVGDHVKLLSALSSLKGQVKTASQKEEQARLSAMSELDRKVEEAKIAGRQEAEQEAHERVVKAQIKAAAAERGFLDPADAFTMIPDLSAIDAEDGVKAAVEKLASEKPYLLKQKTTPLEQGPRGSSRESTAQSGNDWLRGALTGGNA